MKILINCSNLKVSGGLQVGDSVCRQLGRMKQHEFVVVLSSQMEKTKNMIAGEDNIKSFTYDISNRVSNVLFGRDAFLDKLVLDEDVKCVLTIFGPSRWHPKVPHLSGFAMSMIVCPESPFFSRMSFAHRMKWAVWCEVRKISFEKSADYFWTENKTVSERLSNLFGNKKKVYTVSNYYNQVFDDKDAWKKTITLPAFTGITCLSISSYMEHKNFEIIPQVIRQLKTTHPGFNVRFVLTYDKDEMEVPTDVNDNIIFLGRVDVSEVPYLYEQCDIMFMPTLLESFTATYPEAMRMERPIVTTDLDFAHGLCGDAACYYSAEDAEAAAEAIIKVATNKDYVTQLVDNGKKQLLTYDDYKQRADKLIKILEEIA